MKEVTVKSPGKLLISGEWGVLESGNHALVAAVNKFVSVAITENSEKVIKINSANLDNDWWRLEHKNAYSIDKSAKQNVRDYYTLGVNTINLFFKLFPTSNPSISIYSSSEDVSINFEGKNYKLGLGSSAAYAVALTKALVSYFEKSLSAIQIFKLAILAHYFTFGKVGSGFDVAVAVYGGFIDYQTFDKEFILNMTGNEISQIPDIGKLISIEWPGLLIRKLSIKRIPKLLVGWTGQAASTSALVKMVYKWKEKSPLDYEQIISKIGGISKQAIDALESGDLDQFIELLKLNSEVLSELSIKSNVPIETDLLKFMRKSVVNLDNVAAKLSGAGGGDIGIAISDDADVLIELQDKWVKKGIIIIPLEFNTL
jgi:phosphomevalonate kinase